MNGLPMSLVGLTLILAIATACTSTAPTTTPILSPTAVPTPTPTATATLSPTAVPTPTSTAPAEPGIDTATVDKFMSLLTIEDVDKLLTTKVPLKANLIDFREMAKLSDPSQVVNIDNWYGLIIEAVDGTNGLLFTVIDFDSETSARTHFEKVTSEPPGMQEMVPPIGDASAKIEVGAEGIGSMLLFKESDKIITLHTTKSEGEQPLVPLERLEEMAELVASRL